jgi:hypothetical protein
LKGLKKVLFTDDGGENSHALGERDHASAGKGLHDEAQPGPDAQSKVFNRNPASTGKHPAASSPIPESPGNTQGSTTMPDEAAITDMKHNVYALLENINQNGVDFFEVWNAAKEMGGASPANIKAAFTSLRFADRTLSKESLVRSGRDYIQALQTVIETESAKRLQEKISLEKQREETRKRLDQDISRIEEEINALQRKLVGLQAERQGIDADFDPRIQAIETKINTGRKAVDEVLSDIQVVISIMERDIN